ncbi:hypothetical protein OCEANICA350_10767 [Oceanicaulis sp. 350]|nr:hypothetical protein OCEANICA350_10767 [Oceanicaulis sp. 350]
MTAALFSAARGNLDFPAVQPGAQINRSRHLTLDSHVRLGRADLIFR